MSDTPRTDAAIQWSCLGDFNREWVEVKFARELERENAALKKQANDEFDTVITRNMELVRENGRLRMALDASCNAEELRQVRAENAALRAKISELEKAFAPNFVDELHIECLELERENAELRNKLAMYEGQTRFLCQCGGLKP